MKLYIANKNYSSWSLRPWVLMRELKISFDEELLVFGDQVSWSKYRLVSPSGLVPCLVDGELIVWDSFSITEYLAEAHSNVWPQKLSARAWARSAAAEMHSGFAALRNQCPMCCGVSVKLNSINSALDRDIKRLEQLWENGLQRYGGPFLAGTKFTAVDAFFAPVVFRIQTYGLNINQISKRYVDKMLSLDSMQSWYQAAIKETWREANHEQDVVTSGVLLKDVRA